MSRGDCYQGSRTGAAKTNCESVGTRGAVSCSRAWVDYGAYGAEVLTLNTSGLGRVLPRVPARLIPSVTAGVCPHHKRIANLQLCPPLPRPQV
eukprot:1188862-Prorocentrum_minimum.AAC.2